MSTPYLVTVTREDRNWLANVEGLDGAHTFARSLSTLDRYVREVIALVADDDTEVEIDWNYQTGDREIDKAARDVRQARAEAARREAEATADTRALIYRLADAGYGSRDVGRLAGVSAQRVTQVLAERVGGKVAARCRADTSQAKAS